MPIINPVVIHQDTVTLPLKVFVLAAADRPEECADNYNDQNQGNGDQIIDNLHGYFTSRAEFKTTASELNDIPSAAIQGATSPVAAAGMASRL